jgi:hypothetical protein
MTDGGRNRDTLRVSSDRPGPARSSRPGRAGWSRRISEVFRRMWLIPPPGKKTRGRKTGDTWRYIMNVYELVTAKIVERLEEGVIPWQKCWTSGPAKSLTTGKEYRGLNSLLLGPEVAKLSPGAIWPSLSWTFPKRADFGKVPRTWRRKTRGFRPIRRTLRASFPGKFPDGGS